MSLRSNLAPTPWLPHPQCKKTGGVSISEPLKKSGPEVKGRNPNQLRLERFGKAMLGTGSWEAPGAVLSGMYEVWSTLRIYSEYMRFIRIGLSSIAHARCLHLLSHGQWLLRWVRRYVDIPPQSISTSKCSFLERPGRQRVWSFSILGWLKVHSAFRPFFVKRFI